MGQGAQGDGGTHRLTRTHFHRAGSGPAVVLVHAIACDLSLWDAQAHALAAHYDVVRYDVRGHGRSPCGAAPLSFEDLADDLERLLTGLGISRAHIVGVSMGGVIARLFALRQPERVASLVLVSTMHSLPANAAAAWRERAAPVRSGGMAAVVESLLALWFPPAAIAANTPAVARVRAMVQASSPEGYLAICDAVPRLDFFARQGAIRCPALVLAGADDPKLDAIATEALARAIPGAALMRIPGGHFPNLDDPEVFNRVLLEFLSA